jgi:hypothetical protein
MKARTAPRSRRPSSTRSRARSSPRHRRPDHRPVRQLARGQRERQPRDRRRGEGMGPDRRRVRLLDQPRPPRPQGQRDRDDGRIRPRRQSPDGRRPKRDRLQPDDRGRGRLAGVPDRPGRLLFQDPERQGEPRPAGKGGVVPNEQCRPRQRRSGRRRMPVDMAGAVRRHIHGKAQAVQRAVAEGKWRKDPRSTEWVGNRCRPGARPRSSPGS